MRNFPPTITAGVTFERTLDLDPYLASDAWTLSVALRGPAVVNISGTVDGDLHVMTSSAATTATWAPGRYSYSMRVAKAGEVHELETGTVEILPDLATQVAGFDGRTHAEKTLEAVEAVIENRATIDQERYRINNRELYRTPIAELMKLRDLYRSEVQREKMAERGGKVFGRAVRVVL